jgi:hypothetical protein
MSMQKVTIDISNNQDIIQYLASKLDQLSYTVNIFFDYIITPREGYVAVNKTSIQNGFINQPIITGQIVDYVIKNILNVSYDKEILVDTSYIQVFKLLKSKYKQTNLISQSEEITKDDYTLLFFANMTGKVKDMFDSLQTSTIIKDKIEIPMYGRLLDYISENVETSIIKYLNYILTNILQDQDQLNSQTQEAIQLYELVEGTNVIYPKDYGFLNYEYNIIVQSFVWIFCGLLDWLEKDYIEEEDVKYLIRVMYPEKKFSVRLDTLEFNEENDEFHLQNESLINGALFVNNFLVSKKATRMLSALLIWIVEMDKEDINHIYKKFSNII